MVYALRSDYWHLQFSSIVYYVMISSYLSMFFQSVCFATFNFFLCYHHYADFQFWFHHKFYKLYWCNNHDDATILVINAESNNASFKHDCIKHLDHIIERDFQEDGKYLVTSKAQNILRFSLHFERVLRDQNWKVLIRNLFDNYLIQVV